MLNACLEYNNKEELLDDFKCRFLRGLDNDIAQENYHCYMYDEPKYHIKSLKYYKHCINGEKMQ